MTLTLIFICFAVLMILSMPIAIVLAASTAMYLLFISSTPLTSLIQQLFNLFIFCLLVITYVPKLSLLLPEIFLRR